MRARVLSLLLFLPAAACVDEETCGEGEVCVVAGTGELGFNGDGLAPRETDFYLPGGAGRGGTARS